MGGGSYDVIESARRASTRYASMDRQQKFSKRHLDASMNPYGIRYRESCDSDEHPESYPIIIALDETGSMGDIPDYLVTKLLPEVMKNIFSMGVKDPQICFCGIGDASYDEEGPIQVGQFESSDELMEKWLTNIYLEGGGGSNPGESYNLAWYFAARHTKIDSFDKRGKKGCLITIGDEPCLGYISKEAIKRYFGDSIQSDVRTSEILQEAKEKWDIWHIHCSHGYGTSALESWQKLLGDHVVVSNSSNANDLGQIIPKLVERSYAGEEEIQVGD